MAEAFARMYGAGRVEAHSTGSRPAGRVHPKAVAAMQELGYDLTAHRSKGLAEVSDKEFDVAVTLGCGDDCSCIKAKAWEDWKTPCPKAMPPEQFRAVGTRSGRRSGGCWRGCDIPPLFTERFAPANSHA